ncbi:hypothetical protein [Bifidobacterium sp. ESL0732]|nr:hypothetical protein [Bifidobacterium sp. ESL0732]WEV64856.1 hypothetical protein OZX70_01510 [Bifidobacterium sp. ESL0732]
MLIYRIDGKELLITMMRSGSHDDLL